ncbi:Ig-like domain-containing protein [Roseimaritima ulvae]|uniref:Uncharacterized protein n=1 Tax=Roseimaritima ulvae TaxID=980254 RepID=A0A5B9QZP0_9BACT|nr:Ig-like domain-containing protein [Roseimaritima ulvae]QEG42895.1 hypothetical protein UC8_49370 [Roseimaritima ulvae]
MKSIGRLFTRSKNVRRKQAQTGGKRRLRSEALERRELLAGDLLAFHNDFAPADVNRDYRIEPIDALMVINQLNRRGAGDVETLMEGEDATETGFVDVDGDEELAPADALFVVNALNRGQGVDGELIELRLGLRDHETDADLLADGSRTLNLVFDDTTERSQIVDLEVSYLDLRGFGADAGAFTVYTDIFSPTAEMAGSGFTFADVVEPVVTETQELLFSTEITSASGTIFFSEEGAVGQTPVPVTVSQLGSNPSGAIEGVLTQLGYSSDQFSVETLPPLNDTIGLDIQIRFLTDGLANQQLPNLVADTSQLSGDPVVFQNNETPAILNAGQPNESVNPEAIPLNINLMSRSAGGQLVYENTISGAFDADGYDNVGGQAAGNLPGGYNDQGNTMPYDAYSLPIRFKQLVSDFVIQVDQPLEDPREASGNELLLIDETDKLRADNAKVDIEDDPSVAGDDRYGLVVINVLEGGLSAGTGSITLNEDLSPAGGNTIDLSTLVDDLTDPNATLTILSASDGSDGDVSLTGSVATYTPDADFFGDDSFTYVVSNGSEQRTGTVNVTVNSQNDAPTGVADTISATRGSVRVIQPAELLSNDSGGPANEDQNLEIASVAGAGAVLNGDGTVSYTPPATGATATFSYVARDSDGATSASIQVTVNIDEQPVAPTASDFTLSGTENTTLNFTDSDLLANVIGTSPIVVDDVSGLTSLVTGLGAGTLTDNGNGSYSYTPVNGDVFGDVATFEYTVSNDLGSDTATVTINLAGVNDSPTAGDDSFDVEELSGPQTLDVLDNDSAGPLETTDSITVTTVSGAGVSIAPGGGAVVYDPLLLEPGQTTFTYTISDSGNLTSQATVTINVTQGPRPRALDDTATTDEAITVDVPVLANDRANPGETLSIAGLGAITEGAGEATLSIVGDSVRVDPSDDYNGRIVFTYSVTDSGGVVVDQAAATGTVTVTVGPVNDPPVIGADPARTTTSNESLTVAISDLLANDNPGVGEGDQEISVTAVTLATAEGGTAIMDNGNIVYTPPLNFEGTDTLSYTVSDNGDPVASSPASLTIQVNNIDPTAGDDSVVAFKNFTSTFTSAQLLANDSAGEATQTLSITAVDNTGTRGTATLMADGSIQFVPETEFIGSTSFQYTITDGIETATGTVNVDVQEFQPSTISGSVFFDEIESLDNPVRNGTREAGEMGLGGHPVMLYSAATDNVSGAVISRTQLTELDGDFSFGLLPPGTYVVSFPTSPDLIDGADTAGTQGDLDSVENQFTIDIAQPGGVDATDYAFSLIGYTGTAAAAAVENLDLLASTYLRNNSTASASSNGGAQGATASLHADGSLNFMTVKQGFEGVRYAEVALSQDATSALLTIINTAGEVLTANLNDDQFMTVADGEGGLAVRIFGGIEDFVFDVVPSDALYEEYDDFRKAIDQILGSGDFA